MSFNFLPPLALQKNSPSPNLFQEGREAARRRVQLQVHQPRERGGQRAQRDGRQLARAQQARRRRGRR